MLQISTFMWVMAAVFAYVGFSRGWNKEIIATSGIILGLFALHQFDDVLRQTLLANLPTEQIFLVQAIIFGIIVFFAYQTRALGGDDKGSRDGRDSLQTSILGGIVGFINGYLVFGTLWYFMDITGYPLSPYISAPIPNTVSADFVDSLPLYLLAGGPGGGGDLLAAAMIALFLIVLIVI